MKLLIDTNVILDVLLARKEHCKNATEVLKLAEKKDVFLYVSASAITDIYYIAHRKIQDKKKVIELLKNLLRVVSVESVSSAEIIHALELGWADFEDSVQYSVALSKEMDGIVTRNTKDYALSEITVWKPEQLLSEMMKE